MTVHFKDYTSGSERVIKGYFNWRRKTTTERRHEHTHPLREHKDIIHISSRFITRGLFILTATAKDSTYIPPHMHSPQLISPQPSAGEAWRVAAP